MNKLYQTIICIFLGFNTYGQVIEKFKSFDTFGIGFRNKQTKEVILKTSFANIPFFNDSIFIVSDKDKGDAVYSIKGVLKLKYSKTLLYFNQMNFRHCPYDTINNNRLMECPYYNPRERINMHAFYINLKSQCIPCDYSPCPAWREAVIDIQTPEYLKWIQVGENYRWKNDIDSAIICCKKAIACSQDNPSNYYWGARLLLLNHQENIMSNNNKEYSKYFEWIKNCIETADELENRYWYKLQILTQLAYPSPK